MRTLIFGVDGLSFRVLDPMMQAGHLPNFQALAREGIRATLESKYPPFTPPAWTSIATGLKPAKHGVYDFWEYDEHGQDQLVTGRKGGKAIWNVLSDYGKRVLVMNVPLTYPPEPVNGIFVSGFPGASEQRNFTYPHAFREELLGHVPGYRVDIDHSAIRRGERSHAEEAVLVTEQRMALMRYLLSEHEWDFAFVVYRLADHLQHKRWPEVMAMRAPELRYYQLLDEALGEARTAVGPDGCLFVVSDHGFQGTRALFAINEYLYRHDWLHSERNDHRGIRLVEALAKVALQRTRLIDPARSARRLIKSRMQPLHEENERATLRMAPYLTQQEQQAAGVSMSSWSGTAGGYSVLRMSKPYSAQQLADLRGELLALREPSNGQPLLNAVYPTEAFGSGPFQPREEWLLLLASDGITFTPMLGKPWLWEYDRRLFGTHQKDGVFYACGSMITSSLPAQRGAPFEIYDIMPTVLRAMNLPLPDGLDGRVLHEIFRAPDADAAPAEATGSTVARKLAHLQRH